MSLKNSGKYRASLAAALCVLMLAAGSVQAEPNEEKAFLSSSTSLTQAFAVAQVPGSRWLIAAFRGNPGAVHLFDTYEWKKSAAAEKIGDSTDFNDPVAIAAGTTRAYVANAGNNRITVLRLDTATGKPSVLGTITGGSSNEFGSTSSPRPVSLLLDGTTLWVLNYEGTVSKISVAGDINTRIDFTSGSPTSAGDIRVCDNSSPSTGTPVRPALSMARQGSFTYVGCEDGLLTRIENNGTNLTRTIVSGSTGRGRMLLPHPEEDDVLFYVDDESHGIFGVNTDDSVFDSGSSPVIDPLCTASGTNLKAIPLTSTTAASHAAALAFDDTSTAGEAWIAVLNSRSSGSGIQMIRVESIDTNSSTVAPDCAPLVATDATPATGNNIEYVIAGQAGTSASIAPAGIPLQMSFDAGYLFVPNFSAIGGSDVVSVFTDNPFFASGAATPPAISGNEDDPLGLAVQETAVRVTGDESTSAVRGSARIDDTLPFIALSESGAVTGTSPGFNLTLDELITNDIAEPDTNEIIQVLVEARDTDGNYGRRLVTVPLDSLPPEPPGIRNSGSDDRRIVLEISPGTDPADPENGVSSGISGYRVVFLQTVETQDDGTVIESFAADFPEPGDPERRVVTVDGSSETTLAESPNEFIPVPLVVNVESSTQSSIGIGGLTNLVVYTFDLYSLDQARNVSATGTRGEGMPDAGIGLFDIIGEKGCTMGTADPVLAVLLVVLFAAAGRRARRRSRA